MTDIWGHPEPRTRIYVPVFPGVAGSTPRPGLGVLIDLYAVAAILYVIGWPAVFPRTSGHDVVVAGGGCLALLIGACWDMVRTIPRIGAAVYYLPGLALAAAPFALDVYLMLGR